VEKVEFFLDTVIQKLPAGLLSEDVARDVILHYLHPAGAWCPRCGSAPRTARGELTFWNSGRVFCHQCLKQYDGKTNTILRGSKISFSEVYLLTMLLSLDCPLPRIASLLNMSLDTVRIWKTRIHTYKKII
jgi:hypothetical protein